MVGFTWRGSLVFSGSGLRFRVEYLGFGVEEGSGSRQSYSNKNRKA